MTFSALLRRHPAALGFGFLLALASSPGQTFVISLFLPGMKTSFGIDDAEIAGLYAVATITSAAVLWFAGRWIDQVDLLRYSLSSGLFLAVACLFTAAATLVPLLAIGFFALRLGGQGLLTHVAVTAVARYFTKARGKALSLTSIGHSVGEALLPGIVVVLIGLWGWRPALAAVGGCALLLVMAANLLVRKNLNFRHPRNAMVANDDVSGQHPPKAATPDFLRSSYFLLNIPLFMATPLVVTALVFHQAMIAEARGFSLQWFAIAFIAFALARVASALLTGPLIDRYGASRIFPFHLLPFVLGIAALAAGSADWTVPLYWALAGITSGMAGTLQAAIIGEHVAPHRLGAMRSVLAALSILASAAGPVLYGWLAASGVPVSQQLWGSVTAMIIATFLGVFAGTSALTKSA